MQFCADHPASADRSSPRAHDKRTSVHGARAGDLPSPTFLRRDRPETRRGLCSTPARDVLSVVRFQPVGPRLALHLTLRVAEDCLCSMSSRDGRGRSPFDLFRSPTSSRPSSSGSGGSRDAPGFGTADSSYARSRVRSSTPLYSADAAAALGTHGRPSASLHVRCHVAARLNAQLVGLRATPAESTRGLARSERVGHRGFARRSLAAAAGLAALVRHRWRAVDFRHPSSFRRRQSLRLCGPALVIRLGARSVRAGTRSVHLGAIALARLQFIRWIAADSLRRRCAVAAQHRPHARRAGRGGCDEQPARLLDAAGAKRSRGEVRRLTSGHADRAGRHRLDASRPSRRRAAIRSARRSAWSAASLCVACLPTRRAWASGRLC